MPRLCATLALAAALQLAVREGQAKPRWVRLSLLGDTATQMGIAWSSPAASAEALIELGLRASDLRQRAKGHVGPALDGLGRVSEVLLAGLHPATRYYYRVGGPRHGWSSVRSFVSAPPADPRQGHFRFAYVGDSRAESWQKGQGAGDAWPAMLQLIAKHAPLFLLHGGDFVQDGRKPEQWRQYLAASELFSGMRPIMYALGNHDDGPRVGEHALYNRLLFLPRADPALGGSGTEDFYAFELGNALFISLSTVTFANGEIPFARQARWLDRVLQRSHKRWKVVFMHHPIYTENLFYNHPPNQVGQNRAFVEVFNRHEVDLVVASHNHFYERFEPSRCEDPASEHPCPTPNGRGTVYITSGGGGAVAVFAPGRTDESRVAASGRHHFLLFQIDDGKLRTEAIDTTGQVIDAWERSHARTRPAESTPVGKTTARSRARFR